MISGTARATADRIFFLCIALLLAGYVGLGFWPRYLGAGLVFAPLPSLLVHIHAILFVGWITLLCVQVGLIGTGRVATHRRRGAVLGWWAAVRVLVGPATVVMAVRRPHSGVGAGALAGDLAQTLAFAVLLGAGLRQRRDPTAHKRLMLMASASLIGPAVVRWPFAFIDANPPLGLVFFDALPALLLAVYDLSTLGRVHRATWMGLAAVVTVLTSFALLPALPAWQAFTNWIRH